MFVGKQTTGNVWIKQQHSFKNRKQIGHHNQHPEEPRVWSNSIFVLAYLSSRLEKAINAIYKLA